MPSGKRVQTGTQTAGRACRRRRGGWGTTEVGWIGPGILSFVGHASERRGLESGVVGVNGKQENSPCVHSGLPGRDHMGTWQVRR